MEESLQVINQDQGLAKGGFEIINNQLHFQNINLMEMIETHGTPLKFTYLPVISQKIQYMRSLFNSAGASANYRGKYTYCYCTKSSHFSYILQEALKNNIGMEISSAFDIPLIYSLEKSGQLDYQTLIICNGFKTEAYKKGILDLVRRGYQKIIPILDNMEEYDFYEHNLDQPLTIGIRIASGDTTEAEPFTSRLGIRKEEVISFYKNKIAGSEHIKVTTLHFFTDNGISESPFYWQELEKNVRLYAELKVINPDLCAMDIGGGMPFMDSFQFDFDYEGFVNRIVKKIKSICEEYQIQEPDLITEFGKYTVAEASGIIYKVLGKKQQNPQEKWLMLDGSFITNLPDTWAIGQKYLLYPVNNLDAPLEKVYLGGITCDGDDYYHLGTNQTKLMMPETRKTQYIGFFHTGAYQEVLSGYGGIHHCLLPSPKHIIISRNQNDTLKYKVFAEEQNSRQALKILGYI